MKRLLAGGLPRIYQLTPCFRRGERGARHNPEFTMLEWYRAYADYEVLMNETEALVRQILKSHLDGYARGVDWGKPFLRVTVCQAFEEHAGIPRSRLLDMARDDEELYFRTLVSKVEPALAQLGRPVFLHDYPASQASLARRLPRDPELCERFELYFGDIELCNGFGELTDPDEQRARLEADRARRAREGKPVYPIDERFLNALAEGMPPAAGNALGFDRLVAICAGVDALIDVMSFADSEL
jgi:lysyl-tRNA synthetase class 2